MLGYEANDDHNEGGPLLVGGWGEDWEAQDQDMCWEPTAPSLSYSRWGSPSGPPHSLLIFTFSSNHCCVLFGKPQPDGHAKENPTKDRFT